MRVEVSNCNSDESVLVARVSNGELVIARFFPVGERGIEPDRVVFPEDQIVSVIHRGATDIVMRRTDGALYKCGDVGGFSFADKMGDEEVVDYSVIDIIAANGASGLVWKSRLPSTSLAKIGTSQRWRSVTGERRIATIYIPFNTRSLADTTIFLVNSGGGVICNQELVTVDDQAPIGDAPNWTSYFYHADLKHAYLPDGSILVNLQLRWNRDSSICRGRTALLIESSAGYLPRRRVETDEGGAASFKLMPLGLERGEKIAVKVNSTHFTKIGFFELTLAQNEN